LDPRASRHLEGEIKVASREFKEFNRCFQLNAEEISPEDASKCYAVEIKITEMTGRQDREGKRTYWRYSFEKAATLREPTPE